MVKYSILAGAVACMMLAQQTQQSAAQNTTSQTVAQQQAVPDAPTPAQPSPFDEVAPGKGTSAEWIVEAPAACVATGRCEQLPLSNFETVDFSNAHATTTAGKVGTVPMIF